MSASRRLEKTFTLGVLLAVGALPASAAFTQSATSCTVDLTYSRRFASGSRPTVALAPSGFYIEVHNSARNEMFYSLGRIRISPTLGQGRYFDVGYDPSVSLRADGVLVDVHSNRTFDGKKRLFYRVGRVDVNGDPFTSSIHWTNQVSASYDTGIEASVSVNSSGNVVEVHEGESIFSRHDLFYRTGRLFREKDGDYDMVWYERFGGVKYTTGSQPHISIDDGGNILEVHSSGESNDLHYLRGVINQLGEIEFAPSPSNSRFVDKTAQNPGMSLTDTGLVLEVHQGVKQADNSLYYLFGQLDKTTNNYVGWSAGGKFGVGTTPQVATNGRIAVEVHAEDSGNLMLGGAPVICHF